MKGKQQMLPPNARIGNDGNLVAELSLDDMGYFHLTPERIRDIALSNWIVSGPGFNTKYMPTSIELEVITDMVQHAVNRGQVIDFGYWPNDMIREVGHRGGTLYCQGALGHPFSTPYIILHSWDDPKLPSHEYYVAQGKDGRMTCAYLINPFPQGKDLCIDFEAMTFEGLEIPRRNGKKCLGIGDRVMLDSAASKAAGFYGCQCVPFAFRFMPDKSDPDYASKIKFFANVEFQKMSSNRNQDDILHAAAGNVLDPIMVALLLLNTRGVNQQTVSFDRLNKARAHGNKPPLPPYRRVNSASYVTALMQRFARAPGPGTGTHASPVMHVRQGHWRHYKTGERSFIRDTLVNANPELREQFLTSRSHYVVKDGETD